MMIKRIFRSMLLVSAIVLALGFAMTMGILYQYFGGELKQQMKKEAEYLAAGVEIQGIDYLNKISGDQGRITLINNDGEILFDNTADKSQMENHKDREEFIEAVEKGTGDAERVSKTLSEKTVYYAVRLSDGQVLRVSDTQYTVLALISGLIQPLCYVILAMLVLAGIFAFKLSKKIVGPINQLDLENPAENKAYDEIAPLLTKINSQQHEIRKQLSEAKRQQEEFSIITENMQEGLLVIDLHTVVLSWNSSALKILGAEENPGKESIFALNRSEKFRRAVETALSGRHATAELELNGRNCQVISNPVLRNGHVQGAVILVVDITEKMQRENLRREFTANVSHELKTPLTSISGFAEIIQDGYVKPEDVKRFAGNIFRESQRLITLVGDIIKISQMDEGSVPYEKENTDIYQVVKDVFASLQGAADASGVHLYLEGGHLKYTTVKPVLTEIIYNLCDNGIKYNIQGGSVTVTIRPGEENNIEMTIADTGVGIQKEEQQRVFERFYRVDKSHSKEIGGTGLGLSIVKHGAAYLGIKLKLDSTPGQGTMVTLSLPGELKNK
ncbi:MAG: ATP-binding protein [Eubacteriales bacterium]|nr:ATP-binding protein [Eubacteriales bacterium]